MRRVSKHLVSRSAQRFTEIWRHPANHGVRIRRLVRYGWFQFSGRVLRRRGIVRIGASHRLWAEVHEFSASRVAIANPPDWAEMMVWKRFLKPGLVFLDVGANVGIYTLWALDCGSDVMAVEPHPQSIKRLRENLALNGCAVDVVAAAVGERPSTMFLTTELGGANHIVDVPGLEEVVRVDVTTIDLATEGRRIDGVKIDIEGAEHRALLGAERVLREAALIQVEWNGKSQMNFGETREPVARILRDAGYALGRATSDGRVRRIDGLTIDYGSDVFAVSPDDKRTVDLLV